MTLTATAVELRENFRAAMIFRCEKYKIQYFHSQSNTFKSNKVIGYYYNKFDTFTVNYQVFRFQKYPI